MKTRIWILILMTIIISCEKNVTLPETKTEFSKDYIQEHSGKYYIEIPKVYELANVILALKDKNYSTTYFVEKRIDYYNTVLNHFDVYSKHEIISRLGFSYSNFTSYYSFRENSYRYDIKNGNVESKNIYAAIWKPDLFTENLSLINDFSVRSDFEGFYLNNSDYYDQQIRIYDSIVPVKKMWDWLENQFETRYNCYKVIISPLTYGSHSTKRFESEDYKETVMFVSGIHKELHTFDSISIGRFSRYVFTEIDHNYVNPLSDDYINDINNSMSNLSKWKKNNAINNMYNTSYKVFNEYMTWSVFNLYVLDNFSYSNFLMINEEVEKKMTDDRGFILFHEFNQQLLNLYKNRKNEESIKNLYPKILEWIDNKR